MWSIIAYEMLSFASHRCTEWHDGRLKPEHDTYGPAMPHVNLRDFGSLKRLAWAIYNKKYFPGDQPTPSGPCNWACILNEIMKHIFHGRTLWEHWILSTIGGYNVAAACLPERWPSGKAIWKGELAEKTPSTTSICISYLQDTNTLVSCECAVGDHLSLC